MSAHSKGTAVAYCYRSGEISVGTRVPKGGLQIAYGSIYNLRKAIRRRARLAYDNRTWLVPGLPEADSDQAAVEAVVQFKAWLVKGNPRISAVPQGCVA